jgi:15-cis-phytoene synthase
VKNLGEQAKVRDPEVRVALVHAPVAVRAGLETLFALDARLGDVLRREGEAMIAEIRLVWWRDSLAGLPGTTTGEPLLQLLSKLDLDFAAVSEVPEGWAALLEPVPLSEDALASHGRQRGGALFGQAARLLGVPDFAAVADAGAGWALVDFAGHCSHPETAARALAVARPMLARSTAPRWPRPLRPLGMLAHLAVRGPEPQGSPSRVWRMLRHRMTGR